MPFITTECGTCIDEVTFDPEIAPSILVNGSLRPVCPACVALMNAGRSRSTLPAIEVAPGAYATPAEPAPA